MSRTGREKYVSVLFQMWSLTSHGADRSLPICLIVSTDLSDIIFSAGKGLFDDIATNKVREFESSVLEHLENSHGDILSSIRESGKISDEIATKLEKAVSDYKKGFKA